MIPVRQTVFVATDPKGRGNCLSAVLASILERSIEDVIDTASDEVRDGGFWEPIRDWLKAEGYTERYVFPDDDQELLRGKYSMASGPSPRGPFHHAVVCKNGVMVWDPHPSDDGVLHIDYHIIYEKE